MLLILIFFNRNNFLWNRFRRRTGSDVSANPWQRRFRCNDDERMSATSTTSCRRSSSTLAIHLNQLGGLRLIQARLLVDGVFINEITSQTGPGYWCSGATSQLPSTTHCNRSFAPHALSVYGRCSKFDSR